MQCDEAGPPFLATGTLYAARFVSALDFHFSGRLHPARYERISRNKSAPKDVLILIRCTPSLTRNRKLFPCTFVSCLASCPGN
jgi:hypothetical protein